MKYLKSYNESIKNILKPKSSEKIGEELFKLSPKEILEKSIKYNLLYGFKYLCDNNLVDETTKYIIEKYKFNLHHQNELKNYEKWFLEQLADLNILKSNNDDILIYKKNNNLLFNYNKENNTLYNDYDNIYSIFKSKFNLDDQQINILTMGLVEKELKIKVNYVMNV